MGIKRKKPKTKRLQNKCYALFKEICFLRDGRECQVKINYPSYELAHSEIMQVDHCFSRSNKNLVFDISNGTVVCAACNQNKHFGGPAEILIDRIVRKREGKDIYDRMEETYLYDRTNKDYSRVWWLEEKQRELEELVAIYKNNQEE